VDYFVDPIDAKFHWGRTSIQVAFTIFVATETWLVPVEGWFVDRFGPRIVVMFGGIVVAAAWTMNSFASSLPMLYTPPQSQASVPEPSTARAWATR